MQHPDDQDVSDPMIEITERPVGAAVDRRVPARAGPSADRVVVAAFESHAERLTSFAIAAVRDRDVADDIVAEAYLRLVREVHAGRVPENIGGWLYRVCSNLIMSRGRRISVARRALARLLERGEADAPETHVLRRDFNARTVAALNELPMDARIALLMAAEGHDMASIGAAIGRTPSATRTFVCRARVKLRDRLAAEDVEVGR
jgi:RNA polymerase sigma factor (sigma-70 family)